jgi:hypothetical protein
MNGRGRDAAGDRVPQWGHQQHGIPGFGDADLVSAEDGLNPLRSSSRKTLASSSPCFAAPQPTAPTRRSERRMDRSKGDNHDANGGLAQATASRLRFDSDEDATEGKEVRTRRRARRWGWRWRKKRLRRRRGHQQRPDNIDYYFDSYYHIGTGRSIFQRHSIFVSPLQCCVHRKNRILHVLWSDKNARLSVLL